MNNKYTIICSQCGKEEQNSINFCSSCNGPLTIDYLDSIKNSDSDVVLKLKNRKSIYTTFHAMLPLQSDYSFVNLYSFYTPVICCEVLSRKHRCKLFAKLEFLNLTGSVKDRQAIIEVSMAKELGYQRIIVASTGNLAASIAAHSQKAGIRCMVYVPWTTSNTKIKQAIVYGAEIKKLRKDYDEIVEFVKEEALRKKYFLGGLQAFRHQGYKTLAYEIFRQLPSVPRKIIIPMGDGTTLVGVWQGFKDLINLGLIKNIPQMIGVQEKGIDPIVRTFNNKGRLSKWNSKGIARAIHIKNPLDITLAIKAIKESSGMCISVSTREIQESFKELANKEGIYSEYASASTFAALKRITSIDKNESVILVITGNGLKN